MSRIETRILAQPISRAGVSTRASLREAAVVVVEDAPLWSQSIEELCSFLEVRVMRVSSEDNVALVLRDCRPMAVLASMDSAAQDGAHIMKLVAAHDPELPVMMLTDGDAALAGAADAVEEIWGLTSVVQRESRPGPGEMVEFLFRAGQRGRCLGLLPV